LQQHIEYSKPATRSPPPLQSQLSINSHGGNKGVYSQLALYRKENEQLRAKLGDKATFARQVELEDKVKERDLEISGLKKELRSMQRIQDG
jgi:hypothetical protein